MAENNNELRDFIKETLRQIDEGIGQSHDLDSGKVEFDIAISKQMEKSGKVGVTVLGQGIQGNINANDGTVSHIKFAAHMNRPDEQKRWDNQSNQIPQESDWHIGE